jgi:hypothetical protein
VDSASAHFTSQETFTFQFVYYDDKFILIEIKNA